MRALFVSKIRPMISFACAAWFLPHNGLFSCLISRLESLQQSALKQMSGGFRTTPYHMLLKELHIERMDYFLYRLAVTSRAKSASLPFPLQTT
jgi:hypothetical protein